MVAGQKPHCYVTESLEKFGIGQLFPKRVPQVEFCNAEFRYERQHKMQFYIKILSQSESITLRFGPEACEEGCCMLVVASFNKAECATEKKHYTGGSKSH
jgi:hypothetical protein